MKKEQPTKFERTKNWFIKSRFARFFTDTWFGVPLLIIVMTILIIFPIPDIRNFIFNKIKNLKNSKENISDTLNNHNKTDTITIDSNRLLVDTNYPEQQPRTNISKPKKKNITTDSPIIEPQVITKDSSNRPPEPEIKSLSRNDSLMLVISSIINGYNDTLPILLDQYEIDRILERKIRNTLPIITESSKILGSIVCDNVKNTMFIISDEGIFWNLTVRSNQQVFRVGDPPRPDNFFYYGLTYESLKNYKIGYSAGSLTLQTQKPVKQAFRLDFDCGLDTKYLSNLLKKINEN